MSASALAQSRAPLGSAVRAGAPGDIGRIVIRPAPRLEPARLTLVDMSEVARLADERPASEQGLLDVQFGSDPEGVPVRTMTACPTDLPDPGEFGGRLALAIAEALGGFRAVTQLSKWCSTKVYASVARQALTLARRPRDSARRAPVVRRVLVSSPRPEVAELAVVLIDHDRVRAMALRLEVRGARWHLTELALG